MRRDFMGLGRGVAVTATIALALLGAGCGDDGSDESSGQSVAIGPGSKATPPAAARVGRDPGTPPTWVAQVPAIAAPQAPIEARVATQTLDASARPNGSSAGTRPTPSTEGDYSGTMTIEVAYYDYCQTRDGNLGYAGSRRYRMPAEVFINPPA